MSEQYNCAPVLPFVPYKWPLALDLLKRQYEIFFGEHTFEQLTPYFDIAATCRINLFGLTGYFTTDPENVEAILSTSFKDYGLGSRRLASFPLLGEGIFSQDGLAWKHSRELIRHQFIRVHKQTPQSLMEHVEELVADIRNSAVDGVVDLKPHMYEFTLNTTTMLLFGEPRSNMDAEKRYAVRDNFDYASFVVGIRVRLADGAWLYNPPRFRKACTAVRDWATFFASKAIQYKDEFGEDAAAEKYPFIIDLWREMQDFDLVRDQLLHILVAGRDSTASLLSWTFFHLVRNPDVLERLRKEISSVPTDSPLTRDQIQRLSFLRCCLNETLRLYPTLPMNIRFVEETTVLPRGGGLNGRSPVLLPKGSGIAFSLYHLHRLESIYGPDAGVYRPQRWESGELIKKARLGAGFVDFNGGPRLCLGKDFALMEASYAIIRVLQAYPNMRLASGVQTGPVGSERQTYTISLSPTAGVRVAL
ncbi:n-alkane-inducible cytochrome p450 protein [Penicillium macrosclerotiorum]|uniref:n-alkane-inducible cytochrome p450 protein n=1 Tax=Penicillium macrosclerotiorum TaxID=303699 RepID=UPI002548C7B6|nr:n-alkane-inducible cytochrome p450 protein [Penicillium macrosclerotiorum]KAJ5678691.1 n-alkane-inducible cytochrome p450 protein [Penicillium macrosclerotiorum]